MMTVLSGEYPLPAIFLIGMAVILLASEAGLRVGARASGRGGDNDPTLEAAILGLLALLISFTFAMSLSHFDTRRDAVLKEANAIGTAALRARLLPEPQGPQSVRLLRDYVQLRLQLAREPATGQALNAVVVRSNAIQEALWQQVKALAATNNNVVPTGLYIQSLNEMIDNQEMRLTAYRNRVPEIVLLGLYGLATIASAFAGYAGGVERRRSRLPIYVMGILVSTVILLIQDLDRPESGFIKVSQQPMIDAADSIASFAD